MANVSDSEGTQSGRWVPSGKVKGLHDPPTSAGEWFLPDYRHGDDEMWDRLGEGWHAVDGILDVRIYIQWEAGDSSRTRVLGLCIGDGPITADMLRMIPISRLEGLPGLPYMDRDQFVRELAPLVRHKGDDPEEFAERVAFYYSVFSVISSKPAVEIASRSNVPVATVRGWIREARMRGKIPPGSRGKVG